MTHSLLGGSSAKRYIACPGSVNLYRMINPPNITSDAAALGTAAHEIAEGYLRQSLKKGSFNPSMKLVAKHVVEVERYKIKVDTEMKRHCKNYVASLHTILARLGVDWNEGTVLVEYPISHNDINTVFNLPDDLLIRGTVDCLVIDHETKTVMIADLKYGVGEVDVVANQQLMLYMICVINTYFDGSIYGAVAQGWRFYGMIYQPRSIHSTATKFTEFQAVDLDMFESMVKKTVELVMTNRAGYRVGEHCRFCDVRPNCTVHAEHRRDEVVTNMGSFDKSIPIHIGKLPPPAEFSSDQLAKTVITIESLIKYKKDLESEIEQRLLKGGSVKGFMMQAGESNRKWKSEENAIAYLTKTFPENVSEFYTKSVLKSPAQIEAIDKDKFPSVVALLTEKTKTPLKLKQGTAIDDLSESENNFIGNLAPADLEAFKDELGL